MSSKSAQGRGKTLPSKKMQMKRHAEDDAVPVDELQFSTMRHMARRGGVRRLSKKTEYVSKRLFDAVLRAMIRDMLIARRATKRSTVGMDHVMFALKRHNVKVLGTGVNMHM